MKRTIKIMSLLFLSIITLTTFSSCERTVFDQENELVGTWESTKSYNPNDRDTYLNQIRFISFFEEGMGVVKHFKDGWTDAIFVYSIEEETFKVYGAYYGEEFTLKIEKLSSKKLVLSCQGVTTEFKKRD